MPINSCDAKLDERQFTSVQEGETEMEWHYADNGRQVGPVSEEQLLQLVQSDVVRPETLVWHLGMAEWKPFREAGPTSAPPLPRYGDYSRPCASCGRTFPTSDLAMFGDAAICVECKPAWVQRMRQGMANAIPGQLRYAGFWIRLVAQFIDGVLLTAVLGTIFAVFFGGSYFAMVRQAAQPGSDPSLVMGPMYARMGVYQLIGLAIGVAYAVFFWTRFGATPGKMALGLRVVNPDGQLIGVGQAVGRYFSYLLSAMILYIGYMMAGWDDQKRALHDRIASTRVIKTRE